MISAQKVANRYILSVSSTVPGKLKGLVPPEVIKPLAPVEIWLQSMVDLLPIDSGMAMFGNNPKGERAKKTIYGARKALENFNDFVDVLAKADMVPLSLDKGKK